MACNDAQKCRGPEFAPVEHASTLNNRANVLRELAALPGEDRGTHLREGLAATDEALRYCTPTAAPFQFAMILNSRANVLREMATLPGEDRDIRLREAVRSAYAAFVAFLTLERTAEIRVAANTLRLLKREAGDQFPALWTEMDVGEPPEWLLGT